VEEHDTMDRKQRALDVIARISSRPVAELTSDMELVADLDMDSAKALELLVELEDALEIEISDEDAARLNTVGDILDYLDRA
jgi:acyl carrier protein